MSLSLENGTVPDGLEVSCRGLPRVVKIGKYQLSMSDFLAAFEYVMTNGDLEPGDLRLEALARLKRLVEVESLNPGGKCLDLPA